MMISLTGELALVSLAVLIPLASTDRLPSFGWKNVVMSPPPPRPPEDFKPARSQQTSRPPAGNPYRPFPQLLRRSADLSAIPDAPLPDPPPVDGVAGAIDNAGERGPWLPQAAVIESPHTQHPAPPKTDTAPAKADPVRVGGDVQMARLLRRVRPEYPFLAKQARISGVVHLVGVIGKDGTVQNLLVLSGHPLLAKAALDAVRQWVYRPTILNGEPVEVTAPIDVIFTLVQ